MLPVNIFDDALLSVITGLKQRFNEEANNFPGVRIAGKKDTNNSYTYEIIPAIRGGRETSAGTVRIHGLSVLVFADNFVNVTALTNKVCEYLQSLPALGRGIKYISIESPGEHIENTGPQELKQVVAEIRVKATQTKIY